MTRQFEIRLFKYHIDCNLQNALEILLEIKIKLNTFCTDWPMTKSLFAQVDENI